MAVFDATDQNFSELLQCDYAVVDFYGDYCGACEVLAPVFRAASDDMPYIRFIHINTSHNPSAAERYKIEALPTLYYFRKGSPVHKSVGSADRQELNRHIARMLYE